MSEIDLKELRKRYEYPDEGDAHQFWRSGTLFDLIDRLESAEAERDRLRVVVGEAEAECEAVIKVQSESPDNLLAWAVADAIRAILRRGATETNPKEG